MKRKSRIFWTQISYYDDFFIDPLNSPVGYPLKFPFHLWLLISSSGALLSSVRLTSSQSLGSSSSSSTSFLLHSFSIHTHSLSHSLEATHAPSTFLDKNNACNLGYNAPGLTSSLCSKISCAFRRCTKPVLFPTLSSLPYSRLISQEKLGSSK